MNMQELLTYVEELTFKTSMFGYDKDEVDIQLDKICDEAEAIILAKEKEIEELKKESKTALGIAAAATGKTMEELEKDTKEDIVDAEEDKEEQETGAEAAEESAPEAAYETADTPEIPAAVKYYLPGNLPGLIRHRRRWKIHPNSIHYSPEHMAMTRG